MIGGCADVEAAAGGDDAGVTLGAEVCLLDDVAASLRVMALRAVAYDDDVVLWLADLVERAADRTQELADARAAIALLGGAR